MANEEVLGPRKTMFVLVIVVGCFAVLWPRILSPLLLGSTRDQLKPNQFDRDAGCCEVMFASEVALLELVTEVCNSAVGTDGRLSPYAAAECRKTVNETCGVDIAAFMKKSDNVGKTTKRLVEAMQTSNSSCLRENFGVNVWSMRPHIPINSWQQQDTVKQERTPIRGAPHPALRERGRAIPAGAPTPPSRVPVPLPPHVRPPPIPGMRPPLGSPGGPVTAPKSSMGFVMPIYTICIIVFFVYTLSKILFKRTGTVPYDQVAPDPQFRRRVFRDDSRSSPETKLGHKERDAIVTAISGLVAEVQQQMEASYEQNQQRQDVQDNHTRPYTNGTVHHNDNNAPIRIFASEYVEPAKEKTPKPEIQKEPTPEPKEPTPEPKEPTLESKEPTPESEELSPEPSPEPEEVSPEPEKVEANHKGSNGDVVKENTVAKNESDIKKVTEDFLEEAKVTKTKEEVQKQSTPELLKEALEESEEEEEEIEEEESEEEEDDVEPEKSSVKVVGMEMSAHSLGGGACAAPSRPAPHPARRLHEAEDVKSIYLQTDIPQQSKVLIADFTADKTDRPTPTKHAPLVVSGKMTLSLIQDRTRDTPERDPESTVDDFTTASAVTEPNDEQKDDQSDEELEEEIEIEEIEEETEEEEEEDDKENKPKGGK